MLLPVTACYPLPFYSLPSTACYCMLLILLIKGRPLRRATASTPCLLLPSGEQLIGARAYRVIFALGSLPLAIVAIVYFINHRYDGTALWDVRGVPGIHELVWSLNFISFYFLYPSTFNILEVGGGQLLLQRHSPAHTPRKKEIGGNTTTIIVFIIKSLYGIHDKIIVFTIPVHIYNITS